MLEKKLLLTPSFSWFFPLSALVESLEVTEGLPALLVAAPNSTL